MSPEVREAIEKAKELREPAEHPGMPEVFTHIDKETGEHVGKGDTLTVVEPLSEGPKVEFVEFDEGEVFEAGELKEEKERAGSRQIRIWSAGCSSGEEPYTIAILVKETPGLTNFNIEIIASDINENMIKKARQAMYA